MTVQYIRTGGPKDTPPRTQTVVTCRMTSFRRLWTEHEFMYGRSPPRRLYPLRQRGGGRTTERQIYINGHPITILTTVDRTTVVAYGGREYRGQRCFKLDMDSLSHAAILQDLVTTPRKRAMPCFDDNHNDGGDVVRAVYRVAAECGMHTIEYTDNSNKYCEDSRACFHLADFYTLLVGRTWYESIFLESGAREVRLQYSRTPAQLERDRQRAAVVSWDTMSGGGEIVAPSLPEGVDTSAPGSGRLVLRHLRDLRRDDVCLFLAMNMSDILVNSRIPSVHGSEWLCVLPVVASPRTVRRTPRTTSDKRVTRRKL